MILNSYAVVDAFLSHRRAEFFFGADDQIEPRQFTEDGDIREMSPVRAVDDRYANGYGNSKWAGEVLLREAHELCGLPVAVFRSDMILALGYCKRFLPGSFSWPRSSLPIPLRISIGRLVLVLSHNICYRRWYTSFW